MSGRRCWPLVLAAALLGCRSSDPDQGLGEGVIGFYQEYVGEQWGFHCDFEPSCSEYGRQAVRRYGLLPGYMMIFDRLMRDQGRDDWVYARTADDRPFDPVEDNALFDPVRAPEQADPLALQEADEQEAREVPPADRDGLYAFAVDLFERGEYGRAGVEFRRYRFLFPGDPRDHQVVRRLALCLSREGRHEEALAISEDLAAAERSAFQAVLLRDAGRLDASLFLLHQEEERSDPLLRGLLELEGGLTDRARATFDQVPVGPRDLLRDRVDRYEELPHKSPALAGVLSAVLPGGGQLYAGRTNDARVAFFSNALLIGGVAAALHNDEEVTAVGLGFFAVGFYTGNVYGGVNAARRYNRRQQDAFLQETRGTLRQRSWDFGLVPGPDGGAVSLYLRF